MNKYFFPLLLIVLFCWSCSNNNFILSSPNQNINVQITNKNNRLNYQVKYKGNSIIIPSRLGIKFKEIDNFNNQFEIISAEKIKYDKTWYPKWGRFNSIRNHYNQLEIKLKSKSQLNYKMNLIFRVYDDGIAFRYSFPESNQFDSLNITDELTTFRFTDDHTAWWIPANYDSYEMLYNNTPISKIDSLIKNDATMSADELYMKKQVKPIAVNTPITLITQDSIYLSLHEAQLIDYAGMTLKMIGDKTFQADLVPWPDGIKVKKRLPFRTPWRTVQIGDKPGDLIESNLIVNLNEPCSIEDTSWIEPIKYTGIWWGYHIGKFSFDYPGTPGKPHGATTARAKKYIDFTADNGFKGLLIEGWNRKLKPTDKSDTDISQMSTDPRSYTLPHPDYNLQKVIDYANKKSVEIIMYNETMGQMKYYESLMDSVFNFYEKLGINYLKAGYAWYIEKGKYYHHGQRMVQHYNKLIETAAQYKIMVNIHEPIKPTGLRRTYPNLLTSEGLRANEYNPWTGGNGNPPEHTTIVPFTRMLAGPLEYTPGIFDLTLGKHRPDHRIYTTLTKQMAYYVIFFSPLQMVADLPQNYVGEPAFEFIKQVPVNWDTTIVVNAKIGDYITIARQNGKNWYIGSITDEQPRNLQIPLHFLNKAQKYRAQIYSDGEDADLSDNPASYTIETKKVDRGDTLQAKMISSGGNAIILTPMQNSKQQSEIDKE